ncbi:putative bifunctional diguanylate cyclase/phosphodiesterase [Caldimonas tepidiphila]|uniref:putative bifunctional diguanylate cyclase/phosphodiesterase n=1 Tax=Caldimonas tepidiphila TaxID=2315841 RepID=UPI000E5B1C36|nr:EAL domain-containing protein [Caldimonas tepidiphila]
MNSVPFLPLPPAGLVLPVALAMLAALTALRLADRAQLPGTRPHPWLVCAGLALGAGAWGSHFAAALALRSAGVPLGLDLHYALASLAAGIALSVAAVQAAHRLRQPAVAAASGGLLAAAAALASGALGLFALGGGSAPGWRLPGPGGAGATALALAALPAAFLLWRDATVLPGRTVPQRRLLASVLLGAGLALLLLALPEPARPGALPAAGEWLWVPVVASLCTMLALLLGASLADADPQTRVRVLDAALSDAQAQLAFAAEHDPLTRLLNRPAFEERLARALEAAGAGGAPVAVLCANLDDFRILDGAWGSAAGDRVLQQVAARIAETVGSGGIAARIGGDQFAVLMSGAVSSPALGAAAQRLVNAVGRPLDTPQGAARLGCSIGIAVSAAGKSPACLLVEARAAMLDARRAGGSTFRLHEAGMHPGLPQTLALQQELRLALQRGEFELHYQPIVHSRSLRPCAIEALIRWRHPLRGLLAPAHFLPAAERLGLASAIAEWVLEEAARQAAAWAAMGLDLRVSVNACLDQARMPGLAAQLAQAHRRHGIPPGRLALDVGEPVLMSGTRAAERLFAALREIGMPGSIDDFGHTCSLQQLRTLRPREVKMDRSLVSNLESSEDALAIVDAVIRLAHTLDIRVVAKGVETQRQQEILMALGCDELQGLRFAAAMPAAQLTERLLQQSADGLDINLLTLDAMSDFAPLAP